MANPTSEALARFKAMGDELRALEERAGIAKKVEDAQLGPMFPDLEAAPDEYFRQTEDYARRKVRRLYFAVEDVALRRELIRQRRECDQAHDAHMQRERARAQQALANAQGRANTLPWLRAGCTAALFVAVGAGLFQLYGAIGGALIGFFAAQGVIARARVQRTEAVRAAQADLDQELENAREDSLSPEWFNASEERTGERDEEFDLESVLTNYAAASQEKSRI